MWQNRARELLTPSPGGRQKINTNCFHAVMVVHGVIDKEEQRHIEEDEFEFLLGRHFQPTKKLGEGTVICLIYRSNQKIRYQHAMVQWSDTQVFHKSGASETQPFEVTELWKALFCYNCRLAVEIKNSEDQTIDHHISRWPRSFCLFRLKDDNHSPHASRACVLI